MKKLIVDRFEGGFAICEDEELRTVALERERLPDGAEEGSVLLLSGEGALLLDREATAARRQQLAERLRRLLQ